MDIARKSVETAVREGKLFQCSPGGFEALAQDRGAFVTLKKKGELRGCIGSIAPTQPLCMTVRDVAAHAALRDFRFPSVAPAELGDLEYEVSVLSPLHRVTDWKQIQVGRDGLIVKNGRNEGVLLPQVATEFHLNRNSFLDETCVKAGLEPRCWQNEDTDVFAFTALVFPQSGLANSLSPNDSSLQKPTEMPGRPAAGPPPR